MLEIKPIGGALGAEVHGMDLSGPLTADDRLRLRKLLNEYEVIFFRDQGVDPESMVTLARCLGPLQVHPIYPAVEGHPEISILESSRGSPNKIQTWHASMTFRQHPPMAGVLKAVTVPPKGGDTLWCSTSKAYWALSPPLRKFLKTLSAVHDFAHGFRESLGEIGSPEQLHELISANPPVQHPVVQKHPETRNNSLFVNPLFTTHVAGLKRKESDALLAFLFEHIAAPEFTCRFQWQPGSIAIWDNRSTLLRPVNDYFPAPMRLERIIVEGDKPY
jgi:taurine dioxygenase